MIDASGFVGERLVRQSLLQELGSTKSMSEPLGQLFEISCGKAGHGVTFHGCGHKRCLDKYRSGLTTGVLLTILLQYFEEDHRHIVVLDSAAREVENLVDEFFAKLFHLEVGVLLEDEANPRLSE